MRGIHALNWEQVHRDIPVEENEERKISKAMRLSQLEHSHFQVTAECKHVLGV